MLNTEGKAVIKSNVVHMKISTLSKEGALDESATRASDTYARIDTAASKRTLLDEFN